MKKKKMNRLAVHWFVSLLEWYWSIQHPRIQATFDLQSSLEGGGGAATNNQTGGRCW